MRVAFLTKRFPNLSETFVLNQITGFLDLNHDVTVYARQSDDRTQVHEDIVRYGLSEKTRHFGKTESLAKLPKPRRVAAAISSLVGARSTSKLPLLRSLNAARFGRSAVSLHEFFLVKSFIDLGIADQDALVCHFGPMGKIGATLKSTGAFSGKLITFFHGYDLTQHLRTFGESDYDQLFDTGDLFCAISQRWYDYLIDLGAPVEKVCVHRMGIDTDHFKPIYRTSGKGDSVKILSIARLVEKKGIEYGIRAVAGALQSYPAIEYTVAGDGPLMDGCRQLVDDLGVSDNVRLVGWKTQEEIAALLAESHLLLAPSVTAADGDQEGIPVVLMEALAQGLPILSTRHSGIPELVRDGVFGFLSEERDIEQMSENILKAIELKDRWPDMGKAGRQFVEANYNIGSLNAQLEKRIRDL